MYKRRRKAFLTWPLTPEIIRDRFVLQLLLVGSFFLVFLEIVLFLRTAFIQQTGSHPQENGLNIALTACGREYTESSINTIKSGILFSPDDIVANFHIFTDRKETFEQWGKSLPVQYNSRFRLLYYNITDEVRTLTFFKDREIRLLPCATQRLFYTKALAHLDHVIHVDTDMLFLNDLKELHRKGFTEMNESHVITMTQCGPPDRIETWYTKDKYKFMPFYPPVGLQSGIMWMNLTRMRHIGFQQLWRTPYEKYRSEMYLYDQDILNALFATKPGLVNMLTSCDWNYWLAYCRHASYCTPRQVYILHGVSGSFYKQRCYPFSTVWEVFQKFTLDQDIQDQLLNPLLTSLRNQSEDIQNNLCGTCLQTPIEALVGGLRKLI